MMLKKLGMCASQIFYIKSSNVEWREGHGEMWVQQFMPLGISLLLLFSA
jgi:hypothetical protein